MREEKLGDAPFAAELAAFFRPAFETAELGVAPVVLVDRLVRFPEAT
jgi:hypothetical protein